MDPNLLALVGGPMPGDTGIDWQQLRRDVDFLKAAKLFKDIPARLTAYDAATGFYSWTWRAFGGASNATRTDNANAQTGTPTSNPARTPNGQVIDVSSPVDCWLRPVGMDPVVGTIYEVADGAGSGEAGVEIGEPFSSGTTPPSGYLDWRIVRLNLATGNFDAGELIWVKDANG